MAKTIAELEAEAPNLVNEIRTTEAQKTRVTVETETKTRSGTEAAKLKARNDEIKALADEAVKEHGTKWNGPEGQVYVVGERIRSFQMEACAEPADRLDGEVRLDFKTKLGRVLEGARAPKNQENAANLADELASKVSLARFFSEADKAAQKGQRAQCFIVSDGAEFEAHKELLHKARTYPGGLGIPQEGQMFPNNIRIPVLARGRSASGRKQRDSLASDFSTAGALIAPEYMTPIELLRNKMALGRAGIAVFSGVTGNLVFPRLVAPTTSQSLAEGAIALAYDQTFDQVKMEPHRLTSKQNYSRLALAQAAQGSNLEAIIWDDHMQVNAIRADYLGINGAGANDEPLGILNQIGIGVVVYGASASSAYKNTVQMETNIRKANIDEEATFITTSTARGTLRITPATLTGATVVSGQSTALWVGEELIGRPAVDTQQVPLDVLIALVGRHLMLASWAGVAIVLDTVTLADQDKYRLTMNQYIDYALRHVQAVSRSADSLATLS